MATSVTMMGNRALVVIANNRPRYLRLTLEGLMRCEGFYEWDLYIFIDGPAAEKPDDFNSWLPSIPMRVKWRRENIGVLYNTTDSIREVFNTNLYDSLMWIEDDMLLRPDTLRVAETYKYPGIVSLREKGINMARYTPPPNLIGKETFEHLYSWVVNKKYVGIWDAVRKRPIPEDEQSHDCVFATWVHEKKVTVSREPKSYCLHFGVRGKNQGREPTEEARRLEGHIFNGTPSTWIDNLLRVFKNLDSSDTIHDVIYPKNFVYED